MTQDLVDCSLPISEHPSKTTKLGKLNLSLTPHPIQWEGMIS